MTDPVGFVALLFVFQNPKLSFGLPSEGAFELGPDAQPSASAVIFRSLSA